MHGSCGVYWVTFVFYECLPKFNMCHHHSYLIKYDSLRNKVGLFFPCLSLCNRMQTKMCFFKFQQMLKDFLPEVKVANSANFPQ